MKALEQNILIKSHNQQPQTVSPSSSSINPKNIECDYFKYLEGDSTIRNSYQGEYMSQYSWAEYSIFKKIT